ncbi:MAG: glycosyltransferase family 39 protein, partial [Candidatus Eisenbacteria bacterium]|nr:glycosyltransferase family 39 protein [Candidatus Eisenbacteria bacterium]
LALQSLALLLLLGRTLTPRRALGAGAVAGLAFLTRYSAVALLPAGIAAVLFGGSDTPRERRREVALAFAAGFAVPVAPWLLYSLASGTKFAFQLHHNIAYEVFARSRGIAWDTYQREMQPQFPTPWSVLARDPGAVFARMAINLAEHFRLDAQKVAGLPLAIAAAAGALLAWRDGTLKRVWPVLAAAALTFLALVPAFHSERYSLALLPAWVTLGALAFSSPRAALALDAGGGRRVWLKALLLALPLVLAARESATLQRRALALLPHEARTLALESRSEFRPGDKVIARKPHFAFYAGLTPVPFPFADSLSQIASVAREQGVRWLYFSWPEAEMRPAVSFLLDTTSRVPGLRVVRATHDHPAVLYEILPDFGAEPGWFIDSAIRELHRAQAQLLIDRTDWKARVYVALYERRLERWEAAQKLLDEALPWAGEDPEVLLLTADNLTQVGSPGAARTMLERAERLVSGDPRVPLIRGWIAAVDGDPAGAGRWWRPLIEYTDDVRTLSRMHDVFAATKDGAALAAVDAKLRARGMRP